MSTPSSSQSRSLFRRVFGIACLALFTAAAAHADVRGATFQRQAAGLSSGTWLEQRVVAADGGPHAWFGSAVAISGNVAFVGAKIAPVHGHVDQGAVYVFTKSNGVWTQTQKLVASDGAASDGFGTAIALSGTRAIITAPLARIDGKQWQGAAYAFTFSGGSWRQVQKITAAQGVAFETFGQSIAVGTDYAFFGLGGTVNGNNQTLVPRAVRVFKFSPLSHVPWSETQKIDAVDPGDNRAGGFGGSLAVAGDDLLIGAPVATVNGHAGQGTVYVYHVKDYNGVWTRTDTLTASDGAARDNFGNAIAISAGNALIGAQGAAINGNISQGAAYHFRLSNGVWQPAQKLVAMDGSTASLFGASVSLKGSTALIGAYATNNYVGAAYVFSNANSPAWTQTEKLTASNGASADVFGYYTALETPNAQLANTTALIGAWNANVGGNVWQGEVYFYTDPCQHTVPDICLASTTP